MSSYDSDGMEHPGPIISSYDSDGLEQPRSTFDSLISQLEALISVQIRPKKGSPLPPRASQPARSSRLPRGHALVILGCQKDNGADLTVEDVEVSQFSAKC